MKTILGHAPFIRIVLLFILGIISYQVVAIPLILAIILFILAAIISLYLILTKAHHFAFKFRYFTGVFIFIMLLVLGNLLTGLQQQYITPSHFASFLPATNKAVYYQALIEADLKATKNGVSTTAKIVSIAKDSSSYQVHGLIHLFIQDTQAIKCLTYGDLIAVKANILEIESVKNPFEFDSKNYYDRKKIAYQSFVASTNYTLLQRQHANLFFQWIFSIRKYISHKFEMHIQDQAAQGVCNALLLGVVGEVDDALLQAYASSGVIHILSVSGLHVGIFYIIINFLFQLIQKDNLKIRWFKALMSLVLIWFYACLSGMSPSVLRSAVMLTCIIMATTLNRKISIYNSLAASCFILLCLHTTYIYDVGFQLSYLAVLGIVYLQERIYTLTVFKNYIADKIWNMTGVSISAQVVTSPLSIYYFYQFPFLFLFANLLVIPIISLSLPIGFLFMFACLFDSDSLLHYIAIPLEWTIRLCNAIIMYFDKIPFNSIRPLCMNTSQVLLMYMSILLLFILIELKQSKWILSFLCCIALFLFTSIYYKYDALQQEKFIVYNTPNLQRIEFIESNHAEVFTSAVDTMMYLYKIRPFHIHQHIQQQYYHCIQDSNMQIDWQQKHFYILNNKSYHIKELSKADYIIVGHDACSMADIEQLKSSSIQWIFDSSNSWKYIGKIKELSNFKYHATKSDKAYILAIKPTTPK